MAVFVFRLFCQNEDCEFFCRCARAGMDREENGRLMMSVSARLNHAIADGCLVANVFRLLQREIDQFSRR